MKRLTLLALPLFLLAGAAGAQDDITVRPDPVGVSATTAETFALGTGLTTCLVLDVPADGTYHLDPANHFECQPSSQGAITDHLVTVAEGGGAVTVRAVTVRLETDGTVAVSAESPNFKKVLDVPARPVIISGHPDLEAAARAA
jgi:hypothetical protein